MVGYLGPGVVVETDAAGEEVWLRTQWLAVTCHSATAVACHPAVAPADRDLKHSNVDDVNALSGWLPAATAPSQYTVPGRFLILAVRTIQRVCRLWRSHLSLM